MSRGLAQEYAWPTDASHFLTSSFAEYRPGHFHAGVDIKTWGQVGYKVFAVRDGYIVRISVSPFGYGKVIYQKLDTGETAIYAHLDHFNPQLERFVKQEQKKQGAYRINEYLTPDLFPVKKGDVIGYTGSTGIGSPHLHFELRDRNNAPMNPFLVGYKILDTIPPLVSAISLTPLNVQARVNADVLPLILKPVRNASGNYALATVPLISGKVGVAIDCFDQANGVDNTFAVYRVNFYVDGNLQFAAVYDRFSYDETHYIDLDRDYRLLARGIGIFQKLYKEELNRLRFYSPVGADIGILDCAPHLPGEQSSQGRLGAGMHQFLVEIADFFGNTTSVTGKFVVGKIPSLKADYRWEAAAGRLVVAVAAADSADLADVKFSLTGDYGRSWRGLVPIVIGSDSSGPDGFVRNYTSKLFRPGTLLKVQLQADHLQFSSPSFYYLDDSNRTAPDAAELSLEKDFYDDYMRLKVVANGPLRGLPRVTVQQTGALAADVSMWQLDLHEFCGVYAFEPAKSGPLTIAVQAHNLLGQELLRYDQFDVQTVQPGRGGKIISQNGDCKLLFERGAVYKNLYLRLVELPPLADAAYEAIGSIFELHPQDVPLKESGWLELKYPAEDPLPEKLGIYSRSKNGWKFVGNQLDRNKGTLQARVSNLGAFTLIRDTIPPSVVITFPTDGATMNNRQPTLTATVSDRLSGIASERSIVMKLDQLEVIAEYDPEDKKINYTPDEPLSPGEHTLSIRATDNCNNTTLVKHRFSVLK
ncbi:MAG: hypothetical protein ONB11_01105 [candidate division KSB1 bacterium]|nr:hypothetical protein [candidate division KSB1 bacterium]